ncbi:hypothetical protein ACOMHN_027207 [Nucella lapillus]
MQADTSSTRWTRPWTLPVAAAYRHVFSLLCAASVLTFHVAASSAPIQTISGVLHSENFTYYKLSGQGWLRLELYTLKGDVDLYVSGLTLTPTFLEYELKSESCGVDVVDIHAAMHRPVGIGIYAHPTHMVSDFRMEIRMVQETEEDEYEELFRALHFYEFDNKYENDDSKSKSSRKSKVSSQSEEDEEESIWWTILITILKFILEIVM